MKQEAVGILIAVGGPLLLKLTPLSAVCSGEVTTWLVPLLVSVLGGGLTWTGLVKSGNMSLGGFKAV